MNTLYLYKFYFKDSFQGILLHPFLKKKYVRILLFFGFLFLYFFYFYLNVKQVNILKNIAFSTTLNQLMIAKRQTLSSLFGMTGLFASLTYLLLDTGVHLNIKSIYFTKALPFCKKDILNSERLFYLTLALILFELYIFIIIPMLVLITTQGLTSLMILISLHLFFIGIFQMLRFISSCLSQRLNQLLKMILLIINYFYFTKIRFMVDSFIAHQPISLMILMLIFALIGINLLIISWTLQKDLHLYLTSEYKLIPMGNHSLTLLAIIRTRFFKITCLLLTSLSLYCLFIVKDKETLNFLFPMISLIFLYYGNTTLSVRRMFKHYRLTVFKELCLLTLFIILTEIPSLIIGINTHHNVQVFLYGFNLSLSALILGILLPKRISNMNELITSMVMILLMIIYLLSHIFISVISIMILWMIAYFTLKEATP